MPGTTPFFGLPYPLLSDAPNGAGEMQSLASAVDTALETEVVARIAGGLGRIASLSDTSGAGTMTSEVKIAQLTFAASASRRYRIDASGPLTNSGAGYACQLRIRWATGATVTTSGTEILELQNSAVQYTQHVSGFIELPAGTLPSGTVAIGVFAVQVAAGSGGTTSRSNGSLQPTNLYVEDVGV